MTFRIKIPKQAIKILLNKNKSLSEIADYYQCSQDTIIRRLKSYGLTTSLKQSQKNRNIAIKKNAIHYFGTICERDPSHGNKRYVTSSYCVKCSSIKQYNKKTEIRKQQGKIPNLKKFILSKEEAYKNLSNAIKNKEYLYQGIKCDYGHSGLRKVEVIKKGKNGKYIHGRCVDCTRNNSYSKKYGITTDTYSEILKKQNYVCAICGSKDNKRKYDTFFLVEHNHSNGNVRGLVCHICNSLIEKVENNLNYIPKVVEYLKKDKDYRQTQTNLNSMKIINMKNKRNKSHSIKGVPPSLKK